MPVKRQGKVSMAEEDENMRSSAVSVMSLRRLKLSFLMEFSNDILLSVEKRRKYKILEENPDGGEPIDVTPKFINLDDWGEKFLALRDQIRNHIDQLDKTSLYESMMSMEHKSSKGLAGVKMSMDDIIKEIGSYPMLNFFDQLNRASQASRVEEEEEEERTYTNHPLPFIRVVLKYTECIPLFEQQSMTVPKDTEEGDLVEADNRLYDHLTIGKGKIRRRSEAEIQTNRVLSKTRNISTDLKDVYDAGTYVSNFEMYDTVKAFARDRFSSTDFDPLSTPNETDDEAAVIVRSPAFKLTSMIVKRLLASNEHEKGQRRFRNMDMPTLTDLSAEYNYTANVIFQFEPVTTDKERKSVSDFSFCKKNGDIIACSYGIYSFTSMHVPKTGHVAVWSIKNPGDPERIYNYNCAVVAVEFSPFAPSLLAIGLYNGNVEVRNIVNADDPPVAVYCNSSPEPVMAIKWIKKSETVKETEIDPFLSLSQNGTVTKFRIVDSPYLLDFQQMVLHRVEGEPEGLFVRVDPNKPRQANRQPQGLDIVLHPVQEDIYYVLTDEGCLQKCSTNYQHQYLEVWKAHNGPVYSMDFSPWSPKLFLTCGIDWYIRIWMEGVFQPLITLCSDFAPVHCAFWSTTHSTIIISITRQHMHIWDIRQSVLKPVSTTRLSTSNNTLARVAKCGRSIAVGTERGSLLMCALDNMPFPPHFQYDELEKTILAAISNNPDLLLEFKAIGFFGYPNKDFVKMP